MKVETGELLSIGRFARLSGLTVKALRHHDAEGFLHRENTADAKNHLTRICWPVT